MGVGKTAACRELQRRLDRCVFLDGDWCWDSRPFQVTDETKRMVTENICFLLNNFLRCTAYRNVVVCCVMHEQPIVDSLLARLGLGNCALKNISLVCSEQTLKAHLEKDIAAGVRDPEIIAKSCLRISLYEKLSTVKISVDGKTAAQVAAEIAALP